MRASEWAGVDAAIGRPRALERVVERIPPRLAWLARALEALDDGRREQINAVARGAATAGFLDISWVLDVVLADPAKLDPTAVRKAAKTAGVDRDADFPFLDLLRSLTAYRAKRPSPPAAALRKACDAAIALKAATDTVTATGRSTYRYHNLEKRLPRAAQVATAAQRVRIGARVDRTWAKQAFGTALVDYDPARWPDLGGATPQAQILRRIAEGTSWNDGHDVVCAWLYARPAVEQRAWLGVLVRHIAKQVAAGRVRGLLGAVEAAAHLASHQRDLADLTVQLTSLEARLSWLQGEATALPELLWKQRSRLAPAEILALAREITNIADIGDPAVEREAYAFVLAHPDTPLAVLNGLLEPFHLDRRALEAALAPCNPTPGRRDLVLALHAAAVGDAPRALLAVPRLVAAGQVEGAAHLAMSAFDAAERLDDRAVAPVIAALTGTDAGPSILAVARLASAVRDRSAIAAAVRRWVNTPGPEPEIRGALIAAAALSGANDVITTLVADEGRRLRTLAPADAERRAIELIAAALDLTDAAIDAPLHEVLAPFDRFLRRNGDDGALQAVQYVRVDHPHAAGMVAWFLRHRDALASRKGWASWFFALLMPFPPEGSPDRAVVDMTAPALIAQLLAQRPRTAADVFDALEDLMEALQRVLAADGDDPIPF